MRVAIQGIKGSFHDTVAINVFGEKYECVSCYNFAHTIKHVESGKADYGIIAIENSLVGTILENYKLLRDAYVEIIGEQYLHINHNLLALPGQELKNIETVLSHEMALKQCRVFLDQSNITNRQNFNDTASAARHISLNKIKKTASIGSKKNAENYGLEILSSGIQNNIKNYTRFFIIQKPKVTGFTTLKNKATIIFSVENEPGKLALALDFLREKKINLSKIESVPHFNLLGNYDMITDLELTADQNFKDILPQLYNLVAEIKVLGIYDKQQKPWD